MKRIQLFVLIFLFFEKSFGSSGLLPSEQQMFQDFYYATGGPYWFSPVDLNDVCADPLYVACSGGSGNGYITSM